MKQYDISASMSFKAGDKSNHERLYIKGLNMNKSAEDNNHLELVKPDFTLANWFSQQKTNQ